jgi:hypothetical protein
MTNERVLENLREIVRAYLESRGLDGLCNVEIECGCDLDCFMPCDDPMGGSPNMRDCVPAVRGESGNFYPASRADEKEPGS